MEPITKKLYRSENDRILFGVCGGIGSYFDIDATLVRISFVLLTLASGLGILAYIIFWVALPREKTNREGDRVECLKEFATESGNHAKRIFDEAKEIRCNKRWKIFGGFLIVLGFFILLDKIFHMLGFPFARFILWPLFLILLGIFFLFRK